MKGIWKYRNSWRLY